MGIYSDVSEKEAHDITGVCRMLTFWCLVPWRKPSEVGDVGTPLLDLETPDQTKLLLAIPGVRTTGVRMLGPWRKPRRPGCRSQFRNTN